MEKSVKFLRKDIIDNPELFMDLFDIVPDSFTIIKKDFYFHVYIEYNSNRWLKAKNNFIVCEQESIYPYIEHIWDRYFNSQYKIGDKVYYVYGDVYCIKEFEILSFYKDSAILMDKNEKIFKINKDSLFEYKKYKDWMKNLKII